MRDYEVLANVIVMLVAIIATAILAFHSVPSWGGILLATVVMLLIFNISMGVRK